MPNIFDGLNAFAGSPLLTGGMPGLVPPQPAMSGGYSGINLNSLFHPMTAGMPGLGGMPPPMPSPNAPGSDAMASAAPPPGPPQSLAPPNPGSSASGGSPFGGFMSGLYNMSPMLMAMGGATMRGGLGAGFQAGAPYMGALQQRNMQMASMASTYDALIKAGVPEGVARAAAMNPEVLKTVAPNLYTKPEFGVVGQNAFGIPQYGWHNAQDQSVKLASPTGAPGGGGATDISPDLTGEDLYKAIADNPQYGPGKANMVRGIVSGQLPFPTGMQAKTPLGQWLSTMALQAEPGVNAQVFNQRQHAYNDWYGGGKDQEGVRAIRQAASHADDLMQSIQGLGNYSGGPIVNKPLNEIGTLIGQNTKYGPTQLNVHALADELSKIWKNGNNSDTEIRAWENSFPVNGSMAQQKAAMAKAAELYEGGVDALERKHRDAFGPSAGQLPPVRDAKMDETMQRIKTWAGGGPAAPSGSQQGKPDPAMRFNQLTASGMSKQQAYAQMHQEGY